MARRYQPTRKDVAAARALASAITASKHTPAAALREQRAGRLDRARCARLVMGDNRIFVRPGAPAPKRLRVIVLLDASGSMTGHRAQQTMQLGRDIAEATELLPQVSCEVWAHTTGESVAPDADSVAVLAAKYRADYGMSEADARNAAERPQTSVQVTRLWGSGEPTSDVDGYGRLDFAGNVDGVAIAYVAEELRASIRPGEQGLIIVVSDGAPAYSFGDPFMHLRVLRDDLKRSAIGLVSISVASALNAQVQRDMYGEGNYVAYDANMNVLARHMAQTIGAHLS